MLLLGPQRYSKALFGIIMLLLGPQRYSKALFEIIMLLLGPQRYSKTLLVIFLSLSTFLFKISYSSLAIILAFASSSCFTLAVPMREVYCVGYKPRALEWDPRSLHAVYTIDALNALYIIIMILRRQGNIALLQQYCVVRAILRCEGNIAL